MVKHTFYFFIYFVILLLVLSGFGFYGFYQLLGLEFMVSSIIVFFSSFIILCVLGFKSYKILKSNLKDFLNKIEIYLNNIISKIPKPILKILLKVIIGKK